MEDFKIITDPHKLLSLGWEDFIRLHPEGTVFQSPEMYSLFQETVKMKPVVIGVVNASSGKIQGILFGVNLREMNGLAGYFSSRTVVYGGPVIDDPCSDRETVLDLLLDTLIDRVKNHTIFIQFRNFTDQANHHDIFIRNDFYLRDRLNLIVDTSSRETVQMNMSTSRWRQIRKGLDRGAKLIEPANKGQVREFYEILQGLYRYKVKKPLPSWDFFEKFYEISLKGRLGIIRLVEYNGKIIGGILSPVTPGRTIYEWYVCGLDQQYKEVHPSVLATWAAIEYALDHNIPRFDFMGVGIPDREYGVRDFKARFGGEQVNYGRFARINNRFFYGISEAGYNIMTLIKKI